MRRSFPILVVAAAVAACASQPSRQQQERDRLQQMFKSQLATAAMDEAALPPPLPRTDPNADYLTPLPLRQATWRAAAMPPVAVGGAALAAAAMPSARPQPPAPTPKSQLRQQPQEPQPPAAEPRTPQGETRRPVYIDDKEPPRKDETPAAAAPVPRRAQRNLTAAVGAGNFRLSAPGTGLHDAADAMFLQVATEPIGPLAGPGMRFEAFATEDNLFANDTVADGFANSPARGTAYGFEAFPYAALRVDLGRGFTLPIRAGAQLTWTEVSHPEASVDRHWMSFGPRVELAPEWQLARSPRGFASVYADVGADYGGVIYHEKWKFGDDTATTDRWALELGTGVRFELDGLVGGVGYRWRRTEIGSTSTDLFGDVSGVSMRSDALFFSLGGRF
jgi:hypothetical protein